MNENKLNLFDILIKTSAPSYHGMNSEPDSLHIFTDLSNTNNHHVDCETETDPVKSMYRYFVFDIQCFSLIEIAVNRRSSSELSL
jgi:hypothetical protein